MSAETVDGTLPRAGPPLVTSLRGAGPADERVDDLARNSLRGLVLASLLARVVLTVPGAGLTLGLISSRTHVVLPLVTAVLVVDAVLAVAALRRPRLLSSRWLFALDLLLTGVVTVVATLLLPSEVFLLPGRDPMTGYAWGTVALWTAIRGWRTGACLVGGTFVLQLVMALLDDAVFDAAGVANWLVRTGIALVVFAIASTVVALAYRSARRAVDEGLRAGRLAERAEALRTLHDTTLAELEAVALTARSSSRPPEERLAVISGRAARQAELADAEVGGTDLVDRLTALAGAFGERGLRVQVAAQAAPPPGDEGAVDALVGAVREALNNVLKHAGVETAVVCVEAAGNDLVVEVRDDGRGFRMRDGHPGFGLAGSVADRMRAAGGSAVLSSSPGRGTTVRLVMPPLGSPARTTGRAADGEPTWFPFVPVVSRLLCLPLIAGMIGHLVAPGVHALLVALLLGNLGLLGALVRGRADLLRSSWVMAADLAAAAGLVLWSAATEPAGAMLIPFGDGTWLYVVCTVPLWLTLRGGAAAAAALAGTAVVEVAALRVDSVPLDGRTLVIAGLHLVQVGLTTLIVAMVMGMSRKGDARAHAASLRAGRQEERVRVLAGLQRRTADTWRAILAPGETGAAAWLERIAALASSMAAGLRAALREDGVVRPDLAARLGAVAADLRAAELSTEVVVTELAGAPPDVAADALVAATECCLRDLAARQQGGRAVLRLSGSANRAEVVLRDAVSRSDVPADAAAALASVGGRIDVRQLPGRGTRTTLSWGAP